jgi:type I restriction enzyme M protein
MYLHGFTTPNISEYDTLTRLEKWDDTFDVIFSNPPFMTPKGGITPHNRYRVSAKRAEVLFVDYIAEHLNPTGRAAIIVPEGIVFQSQTAYKNLRQMLVDDHYLYGVISLPAGVFNPYSGVKTSILLIDRTMAKDKDSILFVKLNNDGFDLGAQRREIKGSEIPNVINIFKDYQQDVSVEGRENVVLAKKNEIAQQDYILVGERYISSKRNNEGNWPLIRLEDCCNIFVGGTPSKQELSFWENGTIKWISSKYIDNEGHISNYDLITEVAVKSSATKIAPPKSTILVTRVSVGKKAYADDYYAINQDMTCLVPDERINSKYLFFVASYLTELIERDAQGIGVRGVTQKYVSELLIPLPPLTVQEEIVAEIEGYQKIIDGARQVVENYKPTIKIDPTWPRINVGDMYDISYGVTISIPQCLDENGIKIISTAEVGLDGRLDFSNIRRVKYDDKYKKFIVEPNTLLFNWRNAPKHVGKTALFVAIDESYISASFLLSLKNKNPEAFDNRFIWCALNNLRETGYFMRNARQAVNQSNFNGDQLSKTQLAVPSISIQREIANNFEEEMSIVEQNKRLIEIFQQKIIDKIAEVWGD